MRDYLGLMSGFSVREVIDVCRKVTGREIPVVDAARRPGDPAGLVADSTRFQSEFGWAPGITTLGGIVGSAWSRARSEPI
jgi:UDP-glucose 4-epimerase